MKKLDKIKILIMKTRYFTIYFVIFSLLAHGEITNFNTDKNNSAPKATEQKLGVIDQAIQKVFLDFLKVFQNTDLNSQEYNKAVQFLEVSLYNGSSFSTLKTLSRIYENKQDLRNQLKVLKLIVLNYPNNSESFYLLAKTYELIFRDKKRDKIIRLQSRANSIKNFNKAINKNKTYAKAYEDLIKLLQKKDLYTSQYQHTKASLSVVIEAFAQIKKIKYYSDLCKAYYDNKYFKQSLKACKKAITKNPKDFRSHLIYAFSFSDKNQIEKKSLQVAQMFLKSFFVQYNAALYFMDKNPRLAIVHFNHAYKLQAKHINLNKIMAIFLAQHEQEKQAYKHFLQACKLTSGKFLKEFKIEARRLRKKSLPSLIPQYKKGIKSCFIYAKAQHQSKQKKLQIKR